MKKTVYLVTGPPGSGKSTTSRRIAEGLEKSAYIEGDIINHMVIGGYKKPWLSPFHVNLIWLNITTLAKNFIHQEHDVVIDYIIFNENIDYFLNELRTEDVLVKYVVMITDEEELLRRDGRRSPEDQMQERCIIVLKEILDQNVHENHILNSTHLNVDEVVDEIVNNKRFLVEMK
ncbi:AAA family ATPase [Paenibacillus dakarensis]|uniref:AAA family ATPase n=1 Tax=Paenibacillus dakarensis TaxID=1527293 RepID=UPI000AF94CDE|nr:AAA family ATPase [Paenibacillus dakarensis]